MQRAIDLELIELRQRELHAWVALLRAYFPRLVVDDRSSRPQPILMAVGTVARLQADGALELSVPVSKSEELCALVPGDGWGWR